MPKYNTVVAAAIIAALSAVSSGCRTTQPIRSTGAITTPHAFRNVAVGDRVSVEMADGSRHHFRVRSIERTALISDVGSTYPWNDLVKLRRHSPEAEKKRWFVAGAVAGFVVVMKALESFDFFGT